MLKIDPFLLSSCIIASKPLKFTTVLSRALYHCDVVASPQFMTHDNLDLVNLSK